VGDEPLLLARAFPTVIARNRRQGAELIAAQAPRNGVIIMDDGLQNPALAKDLSIAVIDGKRGIGNGRVIPAGPLRAPLGMQRRLVQLVVVMGGDYQAIDGGGGIITGVTTIAAQTAPSEDARRFSGAKVIAYAGIANPERFFAMLETLGADVVAREVFADHHPFAESDARKLIAQADAHGAQLVTTEKDRARLAGTTGALIQLREKSDTLAIRTVIDGEGLEVLRQALRSVIR
jgi:tetraacyldisaccharide 4'-kinase